MTILKESKQSKKEWSLPSEKWHKTRFARTLAKFMNKPIFNRVTSLTMTNETTLDVKGKFACVQLSSESLTVKSNVSELFVHLGSNVEVEISSLYVYLGIPNKTKIILYFAGNEAKQTFLSADAGKE